MNTSKLFHLISILKTIFFVRMCTLLGRLNYALYPNLHLGKKARFYGMPKFKNKPGGKITIKKNCAFRSQATSNLIGINRPCIISTNAPQAEVIIGNNCGFSGTVIGAFARIEVKDNVRCGANTLITDSDWHTDDPRTGTNKPVLIEENVWLGEGVKVLKGVTIGKNSVIGAGSVVVQSIPANVVAAGNPCKVIKTLEPIHKCSQI